MQFMKPAFRNARYCYTFSRFSSLNPNPFLLASPFLRPEAFSQPPPISRLSSSMASGDGSAAAAPSLEKQFDEFRTQLEESGNLRERIRIVVSEIESTTRLMYASLLLVHQSRPTPGKKTTCFFLYPNLT